MPLSRIEIRRRATAFAKEWATATDEDAEAKSFWDGFFTVFDVHRKRVATFEHHVKKLNGADGFVDLFWPGKLVVEHKSKSLDNTHDRAADKCCRMQPFTSPGSETGAGFAKRVEYLFELYEKYTQGLLAGEKPKRKKKG